jgi:hypothetical protein
MRRRATLAIAVLPSLALVLGAGGTPQHVGNRALGFERLDRDGDGYLSRQEALGFGPRTLVDRADANRDGRLDRGELLRFMQGLPRRRG